MTARTVVRTSVHYLVVGGVAAVAATLVTVIPFHGIAAPVAMFDAVVVSGFGTSVVLDTLAGWATGGRS